MPHPTFAELVPPLPAETQAELDAEARAGAAQAPTWTASVRPVFSVLPPQQARRVALAVHASICADDVIVNANPILRELPEADLPWTRADLIWCLRLAADIPIEDDHCDHFELPAIIAARLPATRLGGLEPALSALIAHITYYESGIAAGQRRRLTTLLHHGITTIRGYALPWWLSHAGDSVGPAVHEQLGDLLLGAGVAQLLEHCGTLEKLTPDARWRTRGRELLAAAEHGPAVVRGILECFAEHTRHVHDDTDRPVRALAWLLVEDDGEEATALLARVAKTATSPLPGLPSDPRAALTANAAITLLGSRAGEAPINTLTQLIPVVRNRGLLKRLHATLGRLGAARGWSLSEVMERSVNSHGLDADGRHVEQLGEYEAIVEVTPERTALRFTRRGKPLRSAPAAVKDGRPEEHRRLRDLVKDIDKTLAAERLRVEGLLSDDRHWAYDDWLRLYVEHPVTGAIGRKLLWETGSDGTSWQAGLPAAGPDGWALRQADGSTVRGDRVRLWHPAQSEVEQVRRWRDDVMDSGLRQPFKQVFREVYLLTPAERQTGSYSNRFAGHILRYRQANALMRVRGWQAAYLGTWDGGYDSDATKELAGGQWRAMFSHELVRHADEHDCQIDYCATGQMRFARQAGAGWQETPMVDVPPLVFSEAMRDVDLFVGVTSIATDPLWAERRERRFDAYWRAASVAELTATAQMRHEALARLLPRTKLAGRARLTDRFLLVDGMLRSYKIHLGSGNILMAPNDAYLCIVAGKSARQLHLPFEGDAMLSVILSKAFLLAADDKITDESIMRQIA
jgi:hypothetical protein